ncbi:MAG: hypothetical protein KC619_28615 [Myxococcales bacterium]|nr:hypothetical protein [Myxococcales bacterium]
MIAEREPHGDDEDREEEERERAPAPKRADADDHREQAEVEVVARLRPQQRAERARLEAALRDRRVAAPGLD